MSRGDGGWDGGRPRLVDGDADVPRRSFVQQIMGIPISVHVRGPAARDEAAALAAGIAFDALRADDAMFSTWLPDSPVARIRDGRDRLADAHPRIRHVAALCREAERRTEGAFRAWLPAGPGGAGSSVFDPTGLVKGWSVAHALTALDAGLRPLGAHDVLICAGGDIAVVSSRVDTPDWVIAVEDPRDPDRTLRAFRLRTGAVATSGTAARGEHIVDPATGRPATAMLSATVIGPDLTWADVYATAAFVKGDRALPWLATIPDHAGILVARDGTVTQVACPRSSPRAG
ncbi:FAD:protein FMN transferase [Propionicicella superfundia]|uniref:FAD:protein FMN transferase n=1 Tax=Propionicicella superfundia TaxID=348582 RepID=UPI0012EBD978|nr:FAD:protein FMN transferase [Propionicicella superfundia]